MTKIYHSRGCNETASKILLIVTAISLVYFRNCFITSPTIHKNESFKKEAKRKKQKTFETTIQIMEKLDIQIKNMENGLAKIVKHTENAVYQGENYH